MTQLPKPVILWCWSRSIRAEKHPRNKMALNFAGPGNTPTRNDSNHKLKMSIAIRFSQHKAEYNKNNFSENTARNLHETRLTSGANKRYLHLRSCHSRTIMKLNQCYLLATIAINSSKTGADGAKHNRKMQNWKIKCFAPTLWCSNNNIVLRRVRRRDGKGGWRQYCTLYSKHILWYKMPPSSEWIYIKCT